MSAYLVHMANVVSCQASSFDLLCRGALAQAPIADLIEIRLDEIGHPGRPALEAFIKECDKPVIVTIGGPEGHGSFTGSLDERLSLLRDAALAGAMFVDIDWTLSLELGEVEAPCHRIVSRHQMDHTPDDLVAFDEEVRRVLYEGDVIKLVSHAQRVEDGLRMLRHLRAAPGGLVAFCAGEAGRFTRLFAPILGSPFTYSAPKRVNGIPDFAATAPGQYTIDQLLGEMPPGGLSPETSIFAIIGSPIAHSFSPWVQGMSMKHAHLDAIYVALEPTDFDEFMGLYDDLCYRGLSVTAPFKEDAFRFASTTDEAATGAGACNTLVRDGDGWRGFNTDRTAIEETLRRASRHHADRVEEATPTAVAHALILGAGGAARAAAIAARSLTDRVTIASRRPEQAQAVAQDLGRGIRSIAWDRIGETEYDWLINCTPIGSQGGSPLEAGSLRPESLVLDAIYDPIRTELLMEASRCGGTPVPGAEWFVRQAAEQFKLFTHQDADEAFMRSSFEHAMREGGRSASN
ncbi:MAG: 3-dehydroquinate dehydratase/shikimate dehydrogenase [Planctomycetota bacterium]